MFLESSRSVKNIVMVVNIHKYIDITSFDFSL